MAVTQADERFATEHEQLRREGVPQILIDAYRTPDAIRTAWEAHQEREQQDPAARKQAEETARVQAEQAGRLEELREQQRERQRAQEPIEMEEIRSAAGDAKERLKGLIEQRNRLAPEAITDDRVRQQLLDLESEIASCEKAIQLEPIAQKELERRERERERIEKERAPHLAEAEQLMAES